MIICQNCFFDEEIKSVIISLAKENTCDICGAVDYCIDSEKDLEEWERIRDYLYQIKEIYTTERKLPKDFHDEKKYTLADLFSVEWKILSTTLSKAQTESVLKLFFGKDFSKNTRYGNMLLTDKEYLIDNSILKDTSWNDFVYSLKHKNRFHSNFFNEEKLQLFFRCFQDYVPIDKEYLRGRIANSESGLTIKEMEAPPEDKATSGRANAEGISRLYLADTEDTVLKEIRAGAYDFVSIARFKAVKKLTVVDFTALDRYSPFSLGIDISVLAVNKDNLENINKELGRPMRRNDNVLDYVPTQYLVDYIESIRDDSGNRVYDGVKYKSVMNPGGENLAIFDKTSFTQQPNVTTLKVKAVSYER